MTLYYSNFYPLDSADGAKGSAAFLGAISTAIVYLYKRSATALTNTDKPDGNVIYTFSTGNTNISAVTNGWTITIPSGTDPLYVVAATATGTDPTDTIASTEWSSPVVLAQNGLAGTSVATIFLFKRGTTSTLPAVPTQTATYTFASGILLGTSSTGNTTSPYLDGWSQTAPDSAGGKYLFVTTATAISTGTTDSIANTEWATVRILAESGASGYTAYLTNESHTLPAASDGTVSSYTGATGSLKVYLDGVGDISQYFTLSTISDPQVLTEAYTYPSSVPTYTVTGGFDSAEDIATLSIRATGSGAYSGVIIDKVFSLSKSKAGSNGSSAKFISVTTDRQLVSYDGAGALSPASQTTTFSVSKQNTTGTVNWTIKDTAGNVLTPASYLSSDLAGSTGASTGDTIYLTAAKFQSAISVNGTQGLVITATVVDGSTLTDQVTIMKVKAGTNGTNGTSPLIYNIVTSTPVIVKDAVNAATTGTYSSVTIQGQKYDGNTTTNYGWVTVTANGDTEATTATDTAASVFTLSPASTSGKSSYTVKLYNQATVSGATLLDTQTITVVFKGASGIDGISGLAVIISNESHVFPASSAGAVSSYTGSGTLIRLYEGATELVYDGTGAANSTWAVSSVATNITRGTLTDSGNYVTVGDHSGVANGTDISSIVYTITGKTSTGATINLTKTQTFSKSKSGADGVGTPGADAVTAYATNEAQSLFAYAEGTVVSFATANGLLKIYKGSADVTADADNFTATASGCTGTINTATNTPVNGQPKGYYQITAMSADTATLTVSARYPATTGTTYTKIYTITKTRGGYEIVSTIPTSNLFNGRVVYLTTVDGAYAAGKLYRYVTGTGWTAAVPAVDISGTIVGTQISDGAINVDKLAANSVNASKIVSNSITANEIATNAITADELAAGSVTAGKISVTSLSAITATIGTLRTATTGARTEISDNVMKVYDSTSTSATTGLRVKIGNLAL